jgi:altronate dehydratase small subunit
MPRAIVMNADDNVGTLIDSGREGDEVLLTGEVTGRMTLAADVPYGHKLATKAIAAGAPVRKYGVIIGRATHAIAPGQHVHVHNVEALRGRGDKEAR